MAQKKKNQSVNIKGHVPVTGAAHLFQKGNLVPAALIFLYTLVEFIPSGGSGEVMGSQWFYLSVINILAALFIIAIKRNTANSPARLFAQGALLCYSIFVILAGVSIAFAVNKTESLVTYARVIVTIVMIFNLFFLLRERPGFFKMLAILLSLYLLLQSINTLSSFFNQLDDTNISKLILSLTGNAGNKNILAVSLVLKIPFVIYCIYTSRTPGRFLFSIILAIAAAAVFILNARSSYIGLSLAILLFIVAVLVIGYREKKMIPGLMATVFIVIALGLSLGLSQYVVKKAIADQDITTAYGTVFERLNTISFTSEGSSSRVLMWTSAIDYIKKHPIMGSGFGNWKLASIPYEKEYVDEIRIAKHTHNDFLEVTAELGIPGGLLYLLVFIFLAVYLLKVFLRKKEKDHSNISLVCLMVLAVYSVDAFLNFPMERPVTQFFFGLVFAYTLILSFSSPAKAAVIPAINPHKRARNLFIALLLLSLPACYITYSTHRSLVAQSKVNDDIQSPDPVTRWEDIKDIFPAIPNLNSYGFPISHIKAFYLVVDKKYADALALLNKNVNVNPHLTLTEFLKAKIYIETNKPDSALVYAKKAFYAKPRARSHYEVLNSLYLQKRDSTGIDSAFQEYVKYRKEAWVWNRYIELKASLNTSNPQLSRLVDSALVLFPADQDLLTKKNTLQNSGPLVNVPNPNEDEYQKNFATGFSLFSQQKYQEAIAYFTKAAALKPSDYLAVENTGLCYYSAGDYQHAIPYFDRVLASYNPTDGKSEFLKGISLLNLGNKNDGCLSLRRSMAKGFPQAAEQVRIYCQ